MPAARKNDPITSHEAAQSVAQITKTQDFILMILETPATDEMLISRYRSTRHAPEASDSGIRTRRAELVRKGLVVDTGERGFTQSGRQSIVWGLA